MTTRGAWGALVLAVLLALAGVLAMLPDRWERYQLWLTAALLLLSGGCLGAAIVLVFTFEP